MPQIRAFCSAKHCTPLAFSSYFPEYNHDSSLAIFSDSPSSFSIRDVLRSYTRSLIIITSSSVKMTCACWLRRKWSAWKRSCPEFLSPRFQASAGNPGRCLHAFMYSGERQYDDYGLWTVDTLASKLDGTLPSNSRGELRFVSMISVTSSERVSSELHASSTPDLDWSTPLMEELVILHFSPTVFRLEDGIAILKFLTVSM